MLIQSISVTQAQDGSATFLITAREIFIVDTATTQSSRSNSKNKTSTAGNKKNGRAATKLPRSSLSRGSGVAKAPRAGGAVIKARE